MLSIWVALYESLVALTFIFVAIHAPIVALIIF